MRHSPPLKSTPPPGLVACGCSLLLCALFFAHQAQLFRIAVPTSALLIALSLYARRPVGYLRFTLWIWFLTPLLRRLIDWRFGYMDRNLVLLTPILVTSISGLALTKCGRSLREVTPFLLCITGVLYGAVIGIMRHASADVFYGLFNWLAPVLLGLHVYLQWPLYKSQKRVVAQTFLLGVLVMGAYGVYQYCSPPPWDVYWWQSLPTGTPESFGRAIKFQVRVWSTLNAPAPFAAVMCVGLLVNLVSTSPWKPICNLAGLSALVLSMSRTEWLACALGLLFILYRGNRAFVLKTIGGLALIAVACIPLLSVGPTQKMIAQRIQSFQHLGKDDSFQTRSEMYDRLSGDIMREPFGRGVSSATTYDGYALDSGPLRLLLNFGILGTGFYLLGLLQLLFTLVPWHCMDDPIPAACAAVLISSLAKLISASPFENGPGAMVWLCIGMGLAARRYYTVRVPALVRKEGYSYAS
jgi:hypothetical protein